MRNLRLVGLSADGRRVVFVDDTGAEFATPADDRLRAALRGDRARLGQLEIEMESALRPRDIQARIRAGESPEAVALLAQVPVEKIMPYCVPVIAERQHVAELAQRSQVRRKDVEGPSRRLTDVVGERLSSRGVDVRNASWDAWQRGDGRWAVQATYQSGERERTAMFVFDAVGRFTVAEDDEAKWLTGEQQNTRKGPQPRTSTQTDSGRGRRLTSVPSDDALLSVGPDEEASDDLTAVVRAVSEGDAVDQPDTVPPETSSGPADADDAAPSGLTTDDEAGEPPPADTADGADATPSGLTADEEAGRPPAGDTAEDGTADDGADPGQATVETPPPPPTRKRRGGRRTSVPSWDEIMFGKGKND